MSIVYMEGYYEREKLFIDKSIIICIIIDSQSLPPAS